MIRRAALVQTRTPADQADALAELEPLIRRAALEGAEFVATPEGSNLLERDRGRLEAKIVFEDQDAVVRGVKDLARTLEVEILLGSALVRRQEGGLANRSLLIGRTGSIVAAYDKIHMFDVDLPDGQTIRESRTYVPGDRAVVVDAAVGRVGLSVCYDLRFPYLYRTLSEAGAEILTVPSAFTPKTGEAHWEVLLRARAIENGAFVLAPAQGGLHADGRSTYGRSLAVSPWGEVLALIDGETPGVAVLEIDRSKAAAARRAIPSLANGRRIDPPRVPAEAAE